MTSITDEYLMAYADGELPPSERHHVTTALARDPGLVVRLESFLSTKAPLGRPYDFMMQEAIPQRLLEVIHGADRTSPVGARRGAQWFERGSLVRLGERLGLTGWPAMAVPALAIGLVLGAAVTGALLNADGRNRDLLTLQDRGLVASAALQRALETTPSRAIVTLSAEPSVTMEPALSFFTSRGEWCREYGLTYGSGGRSAGVACRSREGEWHVQAHTALAVRGAKPPQYAPADKSTSPIIEGVVSKLKVGDVLGRDEEGRAINGGWMPPAR